MKFTLPTGATIEGTETEVRTLVTVLGFGSLLPPVAREGDGIHYQSSTHGLMKIKDMNTTHLVNAIRKLYRLEADNLLKNRVDLLAALRQGFARTNVTLLALIAELQTRRD